MAKRTRQNSQGMGISKIAKAINLKNMKVTQMGEDLMVEAVPCLAE